MLIPAHIAAGLIVGKLTGEYQAALLSATIIDLDHLVSFYRSGVLLNPKKLLITSLTPEDPWQDQRNFLHNAFSWLLVSFLFIVFAPAIGMAVSLGYASHLLLDAFDNSDFFPFYPSRRINLRLPITYYSKREALSTLVLLLIFFLL